MKNSKRIKGTILWFDGMAGEGMVRAESGECYFLHFTSIKGIHKNNHHWPTESDQKFLKNINGVFCTFELYDGYNGFQAHNLEF